MAVQVSDDLVQKQRVIDSLMEYVKEYFEQMGEPVRYQILRNNYFKRCEKVSSFEEIIRELKGDLRIVVEFTETGARVVYPGEDLP